MENLSIIFVTWDQAKFLRFSYILSPAAMLFTKRNENWAWSQVITVLEKEGYFSRREKKRTENYLKEKKRYTSLASSNLNTKAAMF